MLAREEPADCCLSGCPLLSSTVVSSGSGVAGVACGAAGGPEAVEGTGDWFTRPCYLSILAVSLNPAAASLNPARH
ncbi:exported hypothetical protein [Arthrobacter sp. 9V]|nr:exported hypothetical protein [Arthrobacter sp. 9V]